MTASTNASRHDRFPGLARCTPWRSSDAVMAAIATYSQGLPNTSAGTARRNRRRYKEEGAPGFEQCLLKRGQKEEGWQVWDGTSAPAIQRGGVGGMRRSRASSLAEQV